MNESFPARHLLPENLQAVLEQELQQRGIADSHVALPVHPWQFEHVLQVQLGDAFTRGDCQRLAFNEAAVYATSSLRSMTPCLDSPDYLKLPMAIYSLGASRYLPAVKMINGGLSEKLLRQVVDKDETLSRSLHLCDERKWWAFMPPQATLFDEGPGIFRPWCEAIRQLCSTIRNVACCRWRRWVHRCQAAIGISSMSGWTIATCRAIRLRY